MAELTLNEGLTWLKTLRERHVELVGLRNQNSREETRYIGANADKTIEKKPTYDVKKLDRMITTVAREIRVLDSAIKKTNSTVIIAGYAQDDGVLGELE
jgi:hypothetical protein